MKAKKIKIVNRKIPILIFSKNNNENVSIVENSFCLEIQTNIYNGYLCADANLDINIEKIPHLLGNMDYKFRKGIGYKGEYFRLRFYKDKNGTSGYFKKFKKNNKKLEVDDNSLIELEYKYIYPLVLSPDITKTGFQWSSNYIIFPYEYGNKQPASTEKLRRNSLLLYNYLNSNRIDIQKQSPYNKRIQNTKQFYGVIRVGLYTYGKYFVAIRDNTELVANVIGNIKTDWGEEKTPIFDGHVSYISQKPDNRHFISKEEAEYIANELNKPEAKYIIENIFDSRSISSRLPIKIIDYEKIRNKDEA